MLDYHAEISKDKITLAREKDGLIICQDCFMLVIKKRTTLHSSTLRILGHCAFENPHLKPSRFFLSPIPLRIGTYP